MDQELFERVKRNEATKSSWRNRLDSQQRRDASRLNQILTGMPLSDRVGCECVDDLYFLMKRYTKNKQINQIPINMENQFQLEKDRVIMLHGCNPVSSKSSDKELIALLKKYPGQISRFVKYPDNWREVVGLDEATKGKEKTKEVKPEKELDNVDESVDETQGTEDAENGSLSQREAELLTMSNQELKDILLDVLKVDLPEKINKVNLVNAVLEAEKA